MRTTLTLTLAVLMTVANLGLVAMAESPPSSLAWNFDTDAQGWSVQNDGSGPGWFLAANASFGGSGMGWRHAAGATYANSDDTTLTSPTVDISGLANAHLQFQVRGESETGYDFLKVELTRVSNITPVVVASFNTSLGDWVDASIPLVAVTGADDLIVRFQFTSDSSVVRSGYQIDNVAVVSLPILALTADVRHIAAGETVTFEASYDTLGLPLISAVIDFGDGSSSPVTLDATTYSHTYLDPGNHQAKLVVTTTSTTATIPVRIAVKDPAAYGTRVVVAVIDTGINPYHATYQRPGVNLPLADFVDSRTGNVARVVDLNPLGSYGASAVADAAMWASVEPEELVSFAGTNVLAIDFDPSGRVGVLDEDGHGTATSDTVLDAFPGAIIVMVQTDALLLSDSLPRAIEWASEQPWIDVISVSMGIPGNAPEPVYLYPVAKMQKEAWRSGKLYVESAGNDPSPLITDGLDGSPWAISVTGSYEGGARKEPLSSTAYPDVASNFTVRAASATSLSGDITISGTSFSCPTVAGTLAAAIFELRAEAGWTGGIENGMLVPPTGVLNGHLRDAMNKTALLPEWDGTVATTQFTLGTPTYVRAAEIGWGHVDASIAEDIAAVVRSGDYSVPITSEKGIIGPYMTATHTARLAYWLPHTG